MPLVYPTSTRQVSYAHRVWLGGLMAFSSRRARGRVRGGGESCPRTVPKLSLSGAHSSYSDALLVVSAVGLSDWKRRITKEFDDLGLDTERT